MKNQKKLSFLIILSLLFSIITYSNTSVVLANSNFSYYEKPVFTASHLYTIDIQDMTYTERTMIATLQGIIANKTMSQIYIIDSNPYFTEDAYSTYLNDLQNKYGVTYQQVNSAWDLVDIFSSYIDGYILYQAGNSSMNAANSIAGILDAIVVDTSIESTAQAHGLNLVQNVTDKDESWVLDNYWEQMNHSIVIEAKEDDAHAMHLRDYATMAKALVFYDGNSSFRSSIMGKLDDDSVVMGWGDTSGGSEEAFISDSTNYGVFTIPADWALNLSVLSGYQAGTYTQNIPQSLNENNVHYVSFYISDGDNLQWTLNRGNEDDWWGSQQRGNFPIGWTMPPGIIDLAPSVLDWYYNSATSNDNFIVGPSGNGFIFPATYPSSELDLHVQKLNDYMGRLDMSVVSTIGRNSLDNTGVWDKYTSQDNIDSLFYYEWSPYFGSPHGGRIVWSNGKPIISTSMKLADGLSYAPNKDQVISYLNSQSTDPSTPSGYSMIAVDAWNNYDVPGTIQYIIDRLDSDVRVVTPDEFVRLITTNLNVGPDENDIALNKTAIANQYVSGEEPSKAVDGSVQNNSKWCSNVPEDKWLMVDLGQNYDISRWVVKHTGVGGETTDFNTRDFKLQKSSDGNNWVDVDVVMNNTESITDRNVTTFSSRYVRLYITNPTQTNDIAARIYEFELYGEVGIPQDPPGLFNLLWPIDGAVDVSHTSINFDWENASDAETYNLMVDDNSDFSSPEIFETGLFSSDYVSTTTLNTNSNYYWKVTAFNVGGGTECTIEYDFVTEQNPLIQLQVDLTAYFNIDGFSHDSNRGDGRYDNGSQSSTYSADIVNTIPSFENVAYQFGNTSDGENNAIEGRNQIISLPSGDYSSIRFLGSATEGDKTGVFRINYTDGSYDEVTITQRDWCTSNTSGEKIVQTMDHRHSSSNDQMIDTHIFAYYLTPNINKTVESLVMPDNVNMHILAITLIK